MTSPGYMRPCLRKEKERKRKERLRGQQDGLVGKVTHYIHTHTHTHPSPRLFKGQWYIDVLSSPMESLL